MADCDMNSIDIDTGGTFTDGVFRVGGRVVTVKVDTTPHDPVNCFMACIEEGAAQLGMDGRELLQRTDVVRYATTAATNAIVQMQGPKIGLLVTSGAERDLYAGEQEGQVPVWHFLDQALVAGVDEAVDDQGEVTLGPDEESLRAAVEELLDGGARLLVVAFRGAGLNPANELRAGAVFEAMLPAYYLGRPFLLLSHQVSPSGSDAERLNSAVIAGYLHRQLVSYLYRCDDAVRRRGYRHPLLVVHSSGGLARVAKTQALNTYNSGPAAGVYGAAHIARHYELPRVLTMDLGGTSTDVAFVKKGRQPLSFHAEIEAVRVSVPMIDVVGLGGGGGSIVSLQDDRLRVGPESAGAVPGPVCYDLGNNRPTVTDANAVLSLIAEDNFLGGRRRMNVERARLAIEQAVADPLNLNLDDAALLIRSTLAGDLAAAIRAEAAKRSFSPEDCVLFAYGGSGPLHAADIAAAAGIEAFYMFPQSPVFSAAGSSTMDIQHFYQCRVQAADGGSWGEALQQSALALRDRARRDLRGEGLDPDTAKLSFTLAAADDRSLDFEWPELDSVADGLDGGGSLRLVATIARGGERVMAAGFPLHASLAAGTEREIGWADGRTMTRVYDYAGLTEGASIDGPALVETAETSCVIPSAWRAEVDAHGALRAWRDRNGGK